MPDQDPVIIADRVTLIDGPVAQVIFFHSVKEVLRIVPGFFENRPADGVRRSGKIGGIEMGRIFTFCKPLVREGIDLQLSGGKIVDLEGSDTDGGVLFEDGPDGWKGVVI